MKILDRAAFQSLVAIALALIAGLALRSAWVLAPGGEELVQAMFLAAGLAIAIVVAGLYPIHLGNHSKISVTTPPIYIATIVLAAPIAAISVSLAIFVKEMLVRAKKGNRWNDILIVISRWTLTVLFCSLFWNVLGVAKVGETWMLVSTAVVMFACDVLATSFEVWLMRNDPPPYVAFSMVREGGAIEGIQYLMGILGTLATMQQSWALVLVIVPSVAVYRAFKYTKEMQDSTQRLLEGMADAVDLRDPYTGGHSRRVADWCASILREMCIRGPEARLIVSAARVHDIGKLGIPDAILVKPGKLTPEERKIMETHAAHGAELLARYQDFHRGVEIVRYHHERWDGKGYPSGLKTYEIPFGARVIAVADTFDAMTTDRPYRRAMAAKQAARILKEERGKQFDPEIVDQFLRVIADQIREPAPDARVLETLVPEKVHIAA